MNRKFIIILLMMFIPLSLSWGKTSKREERKQKREAKKMQQLLTLPLQIKKRKNLERKKIND